MAVPFGVIGRAAGVGERLMGRVGAGAVERFGASRLGSFGGIMGGFTKLSDRAAPPNERFAGAIMGWMTRSGAPKGYNGPTYYG
jgi:hypothetical protein